MDEVGEDVRRVGQEQQPTRTEHPQQWSRSAATVNDRHTEREHEGDPREEEVPGEEDEGGLADPVDPDGEQPDRGEDNTPRTPVNPISQYTGRGLDVCGLPERSRSATTDMTESLPDEPAGSLAFAKAFRASCRHPESVWAASGTPCPPNDPPDLPDNEGRSGSGPERDAYPEREVADQRND